MQLSEHQEAIIYGSGNRLVSARPGSGKTRVLSSFSVHKLSTENEGALAAVSFTKDSATEMRTRIVKGAGEGVSRRLYTGTFHSLAGKQSRRVPEYKRLRVISPGEATILLKRGMEEVESDLEFDDAQKLLDAMKSTPDPHTVTDAKGLRLLAAYNNLLRRSGCMDFADMIGLAVDGMRNGTIQPLPVRWLLVDEAQDIDALQLEWVSLHTKAGVETLVLGDDDQSIYGFRNALGYDGMLRFVSDFNAGHIMLPTNYRSGRIILEKAERVVELNKQRVDKPLGIGRSIDGSVSVRTATDRADEAIKVADAVVDNPSEWGVLARTNKLLNHVQLALTERGIPFTISGGKSVFEEGIGQVFCSILMSVHNGDSRGAMSGLTFAGFNHWTHKRLGIKGDQSAAESFKVALERIETFDKDPAQSRILKSLHAMWGQWSVNNQKGRYPGVIGAVKEWLSAFTNPSETRLLEGCLKALTNGKFAERNANLRDRVWAMTGIKEEKKEDTGPGVQLVTMHSSKGLEFPNVWILACEDGNNPHTDNKDLAEERRLFYVAMTRAEDNLVMSYTLEDGAKPSPYLMDCGMVQQRSAG